MPRPAFQSLAIWTTMIDAYRVAPLASVSADVIDVWIGTSSCRREQRHLSLQAGSSNSGTLSECGTGS